MRGPAISMSATGLNDAELPLKFVLRLLHRNFFSGTGNAINVRFST